MVSVNLFFMSKNNQQRELFFEESAKLFKLLSSPIRLKLINFISFCPRTVEDCANKFGQSVQNISLHLISLSKGGVLEVSQVKNYRYYSLAENKLVQVVTRALAADNRALLPDELLWNQPQKDLLQALKRKKLMVIDLRDDDEVSYIPLENTIRFTCKLSELPAFLKKFRHDQDLVFICKGRMCERLAAAVEAATSLNYKAKGLPLSASELKELSSHLH